LLKESFRQNPDYLIVGEVRGEETYVMFQGMASGHPSLATFHAGSVDTVMRRLTSPPINLSPTLVESLDVIVVMAYAKQKGKSARKIKEVVEIISVDPKTAEAKTNVVFRWNPATDDYEKVNKSVKIEKFALARGENVEEAFNEVERRAMLINWIYQKGIEDYGKVTELINLYYKDPSKLEEMIGKPLPKFKPIIKPVEKPVEVKPVPEKKKRRTSILSLLGLVLGEK
jgi:flagellar protein FlaI